VPNTIQNPHEKINWLTAENAESRRGILKHLKFVLVLVVVLVLDLISHAPPVTNHGTHRIHGKVPKDTVTAISGKTNSLFYTQHSALGKTFYNLYWGTHSTF
jgi:hypothetical protein